MLRYGTKFTAPQEDMSDLITKLKERATELGGKNHPQAYYDMKIISAKGLNSSNLNEETRRDLRKIQDLFRTIDLINEELDNLDFGTLAPMRWYSDDYAARMKLLLYKQRKETIQSLKETTNHLVDR